MDIPAARRTGVPMKRSSLKPSSPSLALTGIALLPPWAQRRPFKSSGSINAGNAKSVQTLPPRLQGHPVLRRAQDYHPNRLYRAAVMRVGTTVMMVQRLWTSRRRRHQF
ncbi:hypothetical protein BCR44DRAFT_1143247 [Catenaria anguillulae PL171]|uniref:Uncharacterized protein n=1 Tax=Catenaria anguillulae PL171 TaxID=765915 RepID=A0A1Y2HLQ5_9FUNG|nr:hypothetical protein BCR44DRAFT_1143247 [Catenaria anguillulae PL171]